MVKNINTEQKILQAARDVFIKKGFDGARMQEIADEAGINKALLHYYFRDKEKLFYSIFQEILKKTMMPVLTDVFNSSHPLELKLKRLADKYFELLTANMYLPLFILNELQRHPDRIIEIINLQHIIDFEKLSIQIKEEFSLQSIDPRITRHLLINFISNMIFPFIARYIIQFNMKMTDDEFMEFLEERTRIIPKIFINSIKSLNEYAVQ